jgi:hypothetical protein
VQTLFCMPDFKSAVTVMTAHDDSRFNSKTGEFAELGLELEKVRKSTRSHNSKQLMLDWPCQATQATHGQRPQLTIQLKDRTRRRQVTDSMERKRAMACRPLPLRTIPPGLHLSGPNPSSNQSDSTKYGNLQSTITGIRRHTTITHVTSTTQM